MTSVYETLNTFKSNMDCNVGLQFMRLNIMSNIIWTVMKDYSI